MCLRWVVKTMRADRKRWSEMESGKFSGEKMMGAVACLWAGQGWEKRAGMNKGRGMGGI